jgi:hypothetical protein
VSANYENSANVRNSGTLRELISISLAFEGVQCAPGARWIGPQMADPTKPRVAEWEIFEIAIPDISPTIIFIVYN